MTTKLPRSLELSASRLHHHGSSDEVSDGDDRESTRAPGLWTGSRDGIVATLIVFGGALLFGGAAGVWFAPGGSGWIMQAVVVALGSMAMAFVVTLGGSLLAGRNAVFWGMGMPMLVYLCGTVFALLSGHPGAGMFLFGAPVFMGLAITAGVLTAYAVDRE